MMKFIAPSVLATSSLAAHFKLNDANFRGAMKPIQAPSDARLATETNEQHIKDLESHYQTTFSKID
jgi:hypothetical protein